MLEHVRVVLVETTHPGNIGAAARAMKNMGLERLYLVDPKSFPHADATARASGADDILARAVVCSDLAEAVAGCTRVFGCSARRRTLGWPEVDARGCATLAASWSGEVALVFGREHSGLSNREMDLCNDLLYIPSNPEFSSLNVAAAVQVVAYELRLAASAPGAAAAPAGEPLAGADDLERFYVHLEETLVHIGFLDPENPRQLMRRLRRLFNRTGLEQTELNILRGILTETGKRTVPPGPRGE